MMAAPVRPFNRPPPLSPPTVATFSTTGTTWGSSAPTTVTFSVTGTVQGFLSHGGLGVGQ